MVLTLAVPKFLTTQASMAVLPLTTVTLVGVVASMNGTSVVVTDVAAVMVSGSRMSGRPTVDDGVTSSAGSEERRWL